MDTVRALVPSDWATGSFDERRAALLGLGIDGLDQVPDGILRTIDSRAGAKPEIALRFAAASRALDGVTLRPQQSINEPWYFQVRHPKFSVVVAYAHPRPGEVRIEYRLPMAHETPANVYKRDNAYGIVLTVRDEEDLVAANQLLRDALSRP